MPDQDFDINSQPPDLSQPPINSAQSPATSTMSPSDNIAQVTQGVPVATSEPANNKKSKAIIITIIALVTLTLLGVIGFLVFAKHDAIAPAVEAPQSTTPSDSQRVQTAEIDDAVEQIDKTLNTLDDTRDFTPSDLTDSALGL